MAPNRERPQFTLTTGVIEQRKQEQKLRDLRHTLQYTLFKYIERWGDWGTAYARWQTNLPKTLREGELRTFNSASLDIFLAFAQYLGVQQGSDYEVEELADFPQPVPHQPQETHVLSAYKPDNVLLVLILMHEQMEDVWLECRDRYQSTPGNSEDVQTVATNKEKPVEQTALEALRTRILSEFHKRNSKNTPTYAALQTFIDACFDAGQDGDITPELPNWFIDILESVFTEFNLVKYVDFSRGSVAGSGTRECIIIRYDQHEGVRGGVEALTTLLMELQKLDLNSSVTKVTDTKPVQATATAAVRAHKPPQPLEALRDQETPQPASTVSPHSERAKLEPRVFSSAEKAAIAKHITTFTRLLHDILFMSQGDGVYRRQTLSVDPSTSIFYQWLQERSRNATIAPVLNIRMKGSDLHITARNGSTPQTVLSAVLTQFQAENIPLSAVT